MSSKDAETFQKSVKHYHIAQSISMLILGIVGIIYIIFERNIMYLIYLYEDDYSFYMNKLVLLILLALAIFLMFIYTLVRYIQYLIALKAIRSLDPADLFTKAYRFEMMIFKISIGGIIAGTIAIMFVFSGISTYFNIYYIIYLLAIIPLSLIIFLALFTRVYVVIIAFLLANLISYIDRITFNLKNLSSELFVSELKLAIPEILLVFLFIIMGIMIVIFQLKLNRVFFLIKQSIGIKSNSVKIKGKAFTFDLYHYLEIGIHIIAGIILLCLKPIVIMHTLHFGFDIIGYIILIVFYLSTAVIAFIGAKNWTMMISTG